MHTYKYEMPAVTATVAVLGAIRYAASSDPSERYAILLTQRSDDSDAEPGAWCLPGGFLDVGTERVHEAAARELKEELDLDVDATRLKLFYIDDVFADVDPRNKHVVNVCYSYELSNFINLNQTFDYQVSEVQNAKWVRISEALLMKLAFNHKKIIEALISR